MTLESLNQALFEKVSRNFPGVKKVFLESQWEEIRDTAAQNAGFSRWGTHLLKLNKAQKELLEKKFQETVHSIEEGHLHLEESFIELHPELMGLKFLLDPGSDDYKKLFSGENARALFWEYNPGLVGRHRAHFQEVFKFLSRHPSWQERNPLIAEMLVGHLISLLPFFDFENQSTIQLLRRVDNAWQLVTYTISHIPLIRGQIYAYGLTPETDSLAHPILIFRGTPYPAAKGFLEAIWSDLHPIKSIGQEIFDKGRPALDLWMADKSKVDCFGMSLGGALAYHAGHAYGDKIEVHAYASPGLVPMKGGMSKICGRVFFHHQDLVKLLGYHPESDRFSIFSVLSDKDHNLLSAHALPPGILPTVVLKMDPSYENQTWARYFANIAKVIVSTLLFIVLLPIKLIVSFLNKS